MTLPRLSGNTGITTVTPPAGFRRKDLANVSKADAKSAEPVSHLGGCSKEGGVLVTRGWRLKGAHDNDTRYFWRSSLSDQWQDDMVSILYLYHKATR